MELCRALVHAVLAIPLTQSVGWRAGTYRHVQPNSVSFSAKGLTIHVHHSSSPLFYRFDRSIVVKSVVVHGTVSALPKIPKGKIEGSGSADDYALRLGLVSEARHAPSWLERWTAPPWQKQLQLFVPNVTVGKVTFLNLAQQTEPGARRLASGSPVLTEITAARLRKPGPFAFRYNFADSPRIFALWLQPDGDDTHSTFDVTLTKLQLVTK